MISRHFQERVLLRGSDGGLYYATQYEAHGRGWLAWYGEHPDLDFTTVYSAQHDPAQGAAGRFFGDLYHLPKGTACGESSLVLDVVPGAGGRPARLREVGGSRFWDVVDATPAALAEFTRPIVPEAPTFDGGDYQNMSGLWFGDDGGTYYVLEAPSTHRIIWFGAHPTARPGPTGATGAGFANVFVTPWARESVYIGGHFVDLPRGGTSAHGEITLAMSQATPHVITVDTAPRGFGLRTLRRAGPAHVRIHWSRLGIVDQADYSGIEGDEPMLDIAVARMDGSTVDARHPETASAVLDAQFTGALASNWRETWPSLPLRLRDYDQFLRPVPGDADGSRQVLAMFVVGWDKDNSPPGDRERITQGWRAILQWDLDRAIRAVPPVDVRTLPHGYPTIFRWDGDDRLGQVAIAFTWADLVAIGRGAGTVPVRFDINPGRNGNYLVTATLTVSERLIDACTARVRRP